MCIELNIYRIVMRNANSWSYLRLYCVGLHIIEHKEHPCSAQKGKDFQISPHFSHNTKTQENNATCARTRFERCTEVICLTCAVSVWKWDYMGASLIRYPKGCCYWCSSCAMHIYTIKELGSGNIFMNL